MLSKAYECLKNVYVNYSRSRHLFYVYTYSPRYDSVSKSTKKENVKCVGKIVSDDGTGEIVFNSDFLRTNPFFVSLMVERTGKNKIHVIEREHTHTAKEISSSGADALSAPRHMKLGATYFINECLNNGYSGRALVLLNKKGMISDIQLKQLSTLAIYAVMHGVSSLSEVEYFVRDHVVPYKKSINKDTVQRLYKTIDDSFILEFYRLKQQLMSNDLTKRLEIMDDRRYLALDGTNADPYAKNINKADYGNSKSGA